MPSVHAGQWPFRVLVAGGIVLLLGGLALTPSPAGASTEAPRALVLRYGTTVEDAAVTQEVGGSIQIAARLWIGPDFWPRHADHLFTQFSFLRRDEATGVYLPIARPVETSTLEGTIHYGPVEPGRYRVQITAKDSSITFANYGISLYDPARRGARFTAVVENVDVVAGQTTRVGDVLLTTRDLDVTRLAGIDRFETSSVVAAHHRVVERPVVYLANGHDFPDALSGAAAAAYGRGPVLLTQPHVLPDAVVDRLIRLRPERVVILGGPAAVSPAVEAQLSTYTDAVVTRQQGSTRFDTSAAISAATFGPGVDTAYLANGYNFPDALSGAAAAGALGAPVLLIRPESLPDVIEAELRRLKPQRVVILGGPAAVSPAVEARLSASTNAVVIRQHGSTRFDTSAAISAATFAPDARLVYIANGHSFPDALSGAAGAGILHAPVLLTQTDQIPDVVAAELRRLKPYRIVILGGPAAVSPAVEAQLSRYVHPPQPPGR